MKLVIFASFTGSRGIGGFRFLVILALFLVLCGFVLIIVWFSGVLVGICVE